MPEIKKNFKIRVSSSWSKMLVGIKTKPNEIICWCCRVGQVAGDTGALLVSHRNGKWVQFEESLQSESSSWNPSQSQDLGKDCLEWKWCSERFCLDMDKWLSSSASPHERGHRVTLRNQNPGCGHAMCGRSRHIFIKLVNEHFLHTGSTGRNLT